MTFWCRTVTWAKFLQSAAVLEAGRPRAASCIVSGQPRALGRYRTMGKKGTGRKVSGGGKSRTNKDHRMASRRGIVKGRWDDIVASQLRPEVETINGRTQAAVVKEKTDLDPDKPGLGQFYCIACARYCINQKALDDHRKCSKHKRREKMLLTETPYSHAEANAGAGRGATDHGAKVGVRNDIDMDGPACGPVS